MIEHASKHDKPSYFSFNHRTACCFEYDDPRNVVSEWLKALRQIKAQTLISIKPNKQKKVFANLICVTNFYLLNLNEFST